jgi:hypothetical protein
MIGFAKGVKMTETNVRSSKRIVKREKEEAAEIVACLCYNALYVAGGYSMKRVIICVFVALHQGGTLDYYNNIIFHHC